jgi:hypothetical protein
MECFYRLDGYKKLTKMRGNIFFNNFNTKKFRLYELVRMLTFRPTSP